MRDQLTVRIVQGNSLFWPVLLIILAFMYWKWVLMFVGLIAAAFLIGWGIKCLAADARDQRALELHRQEMARLETERLRRNATVENELFHQGDPRGTYGMDYSYGKEPGS